MIDPLSIVRRVRAPFERVFPWQLGVDWRPWRPIPWAPFFGPGSPPQSVHARSVLDDIAKRHDAEFDALKLGAFNTSSQRIAPDLRLVARLLKDPEALSVPFPIQLGRYRGVSTSPYWSAVWGGPVPWALQNLAVRLPLVGGLLGRAIRAWRNL